MTWLDTRTVEAKVISTQRYPQSSDAKETAKIAKGEQEADCVLRQTARPFYFPFVCERVRRKTLLSCGNSYPRSCLRLVLYTISQSLMKSLTVGSSVMHVYALEALHCCAVQITMDICGQRCEYKRSVDSSVRKVGRRRGKGRKNGQRKHEDRGPLPCPMNER